MTTNSDGWMSTPKWPPGHREAAADGAEDDQDSEHYKITFRPGLPRVEGQPSRHFEELRDFAGGILCGERREVARHARASSGRIEGSFDERAHDQALELCGKLALLRRPLGSTFECDSMSCGSGPMNGGAPVASQ